MFGIYFGRYLVDNGIITLEQYEDIIFDNKNARVKLGLLAVEQGVMTTSQADEVNMLQQTLDRRFGDIAVEKGYLTEEQVLGLLKKQGDEYLLFVQALVEKELLSLEQIQREINNFKKANHFTALDVEALKSGDVDRIVPVFAKDDAIQPIVRDYVALVARNIVRFIDSRFMMERVERMDQYSAPYMSLQELDGDYRLLTGFCGEQEGLKFLGQTFVNRGYEEVELDDMDDILDILDAACEFLNCNNGLYSTKLSYEDVNVDMCPPDMRDTPSTIDSDGNMYKISFYLKGKKVDLVVCIQSKWKVN
ncbi:MAG: hypothetical protein Q4D51_07760 [Eubacteriales bacterium]|nr:hypothetical protein [Eubacteriales bacterium]